MKRITIISLLLCMLVGFTPIYAQQTQTVTGTVVDDQGEPIIGATIAAANNPKNGTISDMDGNFSIKVPAGTKIKISFIGYVTQTVTAANAKRVVLKEDENSLDDVVVVGYGALKQKNVTGSIEVIDPEEIKDLAVSSLSEALIGLSPSVHVSMPSTGRPLSLIHI